MTLLKRSEEMDNAFGFLHSSGGKSWKAGADLCKLFPGHLVKRAFGQIGWLESCDAESPSPQIRRWCSAEEFLDSGLRLVGAPATKFMFPATIRRPSWPALDQGPDIRWQSIKWREQFCDSFATQPHAKHLRAPECKARVSATDPWPW